MNLLNHFVYNYTDLVKSFTMKDLLFLEVHKFFKPLKSLHFLLACSGGPDSICLFYLMKKIGLSFAVLHIDHGWRQESKEEAEELQKIVRAAGVDFHLRNIEGFDFKKGNIEDRLRQERLRFYREVASQIKADKIVTGHQKNDRVETVLKRLFEGSHLTEIYGLSQLDSHFARPLLSVSKSSIIKWLEKEGVFYFEDKTNLDERYLRARMRVSLIPKIVEGFGKDIEGSLVEIGERSLELKEYLDRKIEPYLARLDFNNLEISFREGPAEPLERVHLMRAIAKRLKVTMNREQISNALLLIEKGGGKKLFIEKTVWIFSKKGVQIVAPISKNRQLSNHFCCRVDQQ